MTKPSVIRRYSGHTGDIWQKTISLIPTKLFMESGNLIKYNAMDNLFISKKLILEAWEFLRKNNNSIPNETLDFMKDSAIASMDKITREAELLSTNPFPESDDNRDRAIRRIVTLLREHYLFDDHCDLCKAAIKEIITGRDSIKEVMTGRDRQKITLRADFNVSGILTHFHIES